MRRLANLFLVFFLADAIISSVDELPYFSGHAGLLSDVRIAITWGVIGLSVAVYLSLCLDKPWPKLIFVPQLIFVFWLVTRFWPLPVMFPKSSYALGVCSAQVLIGAAPLLFIRLKSRKHFLLTKKMFGSASFSLKSTILYIAGNLAILPAALIFAGVAATSLYLYEHTAGFARLTPSGLYMTEKIYRLADKRVRLTIMIHIADRDYFNSLVDSISADHTIILAEGVTDRDSLLSMRFGYVRLARLLGLVSQEEVKFNGTMIDPSDLQASAASNGDGGAHILRADIDVKQFSPKTIEFLNAVGTYILNSPSFMQGLHDYRIWAKENTDSKTAGLILNDILHRRNAAVINHLETVLKYYDTVVIPWGALHMPAIEAAVVDQAFTLAETRQRISIDFKKLLFSGVLRRRMPSGEAGI